MQKVSSGAHPKFKLTHPVSHQTQLTKLPTDNTHIELAAKMHDYYSSCGTTTSLTGVLLKLKRNTSLISGTGAEQHSSTDTQGSGDVEVNDH